MSTYLTFAAPAFLAVLLALSFWSRRRALRALQADVAEFARERDDARTRAGRAESELARIAGLVRSLAARLEVAARSAESTLAESREAELERGDQARRLSSAVEEVSTAATETAGLSAQSAAVHERGTEAVERITSASRDLGRSLRKVSDLSERTGAVSDECRNRLALARGASVRLNERLRELVRRSEELPGVAERLMSNGEVVRFTVADFEKEASGIMGLVLQGGHEVEELGKRTEEIVSILEFMSSVAEETNLLALNASIIAAEAGPEGRGFAVVAEEIRELSERMASSTREISSLVGTVKSGIDEATDVIRRGGDRSAGARKLAQRTANALDALLREADTASRLVRSMPSGTTDRNAADPVETLSELDQHLVNAGGVRGEIRSEKERLEPALDSIQTSAQSMSAVVADSARANAEIAARLTHMKELTIPIRRIGEEHAACEETCRQSAARLDRALGELRARIIELDGIFASMPSADPAESTRSRTTLSSSAPATLAEVRSRPHSDSATPLVGAS